MLLIIIFYYNYVKEFREVCQGETFSATCADDEVILVRNATYGRLRVNRCVSRDFGLTGCGVSVLRQTDRMCSGRHSCEILVTHQTFDNPLTTCPRKLASYFEVTYECIKGLYLVHK